MADMYQFGDWRVEPHLNRISRGDEEKQLEPKAMDVLAYLLMRNGETVTAGELLDQLWPGVVVEEDAVYQRIAKIRKALGDDARDPHYIQNIPRRGYRVIASVEPIDDKTPVDTDLLATLEAQTPPFPAYDGEGSYIFVCYAHRDREQVYPELIGLRDAGANVWYDEGISPGSEWTEELANAISGCTQFLYYISEASVASRNCRDEVQFALKHDKPVVTVHIELTELPGSLELSIGSTQALLKYEIIPAEYRRKLLSVLDVEGTPPEPSTTNLATFQEPEDLSLPKRRHRVVAIGAIAAVLLVPAGWFGLVFYSESGDAPITTIAVLPLENLMGDSEQDYFVAGMHEALIQQLSKISSLTVISRTSAMAYRNTDKSVPEIARELGVDAVVEGSVLRAENTVRITAQLIEVATDHPLWADNFDRELKDILALHSDVARAIARQIRVTLTPEDDSRLMASRPVDPVAYEAYLKGRHHSNQWPEGIDRAFEYFNEAIEKDPEYAPAYAWLAFCYNFLGFWQSPHEVYPKARMAALKALELDESLAEAHTAIGNVNLWFDWDWEGAERAWRRALELNSNSTEALRLAGISLIWTRGRYEEGPHTSDGLGNLTRTIVF